MKTVVFVVLAAVLFACQEKELPEGVHLIDLRNIVFSKSLPLFEFDEEGVEIIKLETRDDVLVGNGPRVALVDSLLLVYSEESGLQVFDSRTGKHRYTLMGYRDRGPLGWDEIADVTKLTIYKNKILLHKWNTCGIWDFTTGKMLDDDVPIGIKTFASSHFVNDSVLIVDRAVINPWHTTDKVAILSVGDGSTVHGFGLIEEIDSFNGSRSDRSYLWRFGDDFTYYSKVCDTIYGINTKTFEMYPRFVLDFRRRDQAVDEAAEMFSDGIFVSSILESDRYLLMYFYLGTDIDLLKRNYRHALVYYDKEERRTVYVDGKPENALPVPFFPQGITSDGRAYRVMQAIDLIAELGAERAAELGIAEDDNPVIVVAKLKK